MTGAGKRQGKGGHDPDENRDRCIGPYERGDDNIANVAPKR
jgi:hypothetical protein